MTTDNYDAVEPPHYKRGPIIKVLIGEAGTRGLHHVFHPLACIEVMRHMLDPRLATAFKYIWRVAFGGKCEPGMEQATQRQRDERDIKSAVWYLQDWLENPVDALAFAAETAYDRVMVSTVDVKQFGDENLVATHGESPPFDTPIRQALRKHFGSEL